MSNNHRRLNIIYGRVDRASAETVDSCSIRGRVKPKTIKIGIHSSAIKSDGVKPPSCVVDRW